MEALKLTLKLGLICLISAALLAGANHLTSKLITKAEEESLVNSLRTTLPEFDNSPVADAVTVKSDKYGDILVYQGKKERNISGYSFRWQAQNGFSGPIEFLIGLTPEGTIYGLSILKHAETPGLGAKITEKSFLKQFKERSLNNTKWAVKKDGGDVDAITGATITPRALANGIKEALEFFNNFKDGNNSLASDDDTKISRPSKWAKAPRPNISPSPACFRLASLRYAISDSPFVKEAQECFNRQATTFGLCVCQNKFQHPVDLPEGATANELRNEAKKFIRVNNHDASIQALCKIPQNELTTDDVAYMIKLINASRHCALSIDCVNNIFAQCPIIAAHANPDHPVESKE